MTVSQPGNMYDYYKKTQLAVRHGSMRIGARLLRSKRSSASANGAGKSSASANGAGKSSASANGAGKSSASANGAGTSGGFPRQSLNDCRVLFLRQNQIGDALISTPVFAALHRHFPDITLDVLLNRRNASVYDNDSNIRRTYVIKRRPLDILPVIRLIREERYDFVVDLLHSKSSTSTAICLLSNAKLTVGPERDNDFAYDIVIPRATQSTDRMLTRTAACLRVFNIDPDNEPLHAYFNLPPDTDAFAESLRWQMLQTSGADETSTRRLFGVNISGSKAEKYLGTAKLIETLKLLQRSYPNDVFMLIYAPPYAEKAKEIQRNTSAQLAGTLPTLNHFAAVIAKLDRLITTDSAAVHFADIFSVPLVTLSIDPESNTLWNPSFTAFETVRGENFSLDSITPHDVADAWQRLANRLESSDVSRRAG